MTPDQMAELAARLRYEACAIRATGQHIKDADDLDRAADLIEQMAQAEPIATVYYPRTGGNVGVSWRAIPETGAMPPEGAKLYLAPPAQRVPLSDEQIERVRASCVDTPAELAGRRYGWAIHFARAIEQAHGIRSEK